MKNRVHAPGKSFIWRLLSGIGITVTVRDAVDMELDGFTRQELLQILDDLYEKRTALYFHEPIGESTDAYALWDDQLFSLQDQICQVEEALESAADGSIEGELLSWSASAPMFRAAAMQ